MSIIARLSSWAWADRTHPRVRRWGVPLFCAVLGLPYVLTAAEESGIAEELALTLAVAVPLLWRERRPMLVFALITTSAVLTTYAGPSHDANASADVARLVALFNVGRFATPGQILVALAMSMAQLFARTAGLPADGRPEYTARPELGLLLGVVTVTAIACLGLATRLVNVVIAALQKEKDQQARLAVAQERARVSKEMHDILGHTLAVMVGLADGAAGLTEAKPQRGAETLRIIADSGRGALAELRRLLAVIGDSDGPHDVPLTPQPGLADLDPLVERVRAAGPSVSLSTDGDLSTLAPGLQLAVYRIVQEALTNTLKYAAADTSSSVRVSVERGTVHVDVEDTGPLRAPRARRRSTGNGRGLIGMRERAAIYQGQVTVGPNRAGGWSVHARLLTTPPSP
ncbi:sensor histidine kinase [Streptomyces sp. WI04-05B]|uniref:sensor histidine kinase n=1 Tax=Streptomyces TaxID=1883 RepID=UPI0029B6082D|nr:MULTISPECIES: histidine kinase [unclassified Streptomyces]MDX2544617.1 histidine kinase [Streptomyces sp. WI04-05B]MDX2588032.1 histidine kinase [Streptomyces sp. WI04-05A]MDX3751781.1 histidine kinase [Streptomyces sp. AK08-02]